MKDLKSTSSDYNKKIETEIRERSKEEKHREKVGRNRYKDIKEQKSGKIENKMNTMKL